MPTSKVILTVVLWALVAGFTAVALAQSNAPEKKTVEGITNFTQLDATIACAGATKASSVPELKNMGFVSIVNLRRPTEEGADVEAEKAAAEAAGLKYFHLPFSAPRTPEENVDKTVEDFLAAVGNKANQPVFVHCASGGRAAAMWLIKRVRLDGWDVAKAKAEADLVSQNNASIDWAVKYVQATNR